MEELEWVIERQMVYYNTERRHSGLGYRAPVVYLRQEGIHPRVLVETGPRSGSVSGVHVPSFRLCAIIVSRIGVGSQLRNSYSTILYFLWKVSVEPERRTK
ncbi:hypothetical protein H5T53_04810 [Candidatus Bipolaricaulota bacterium]|nr:hypothetical protein [Candidatus Bipolaricaulota bacterium]